ESFGAHRKAPDDQWEDPYEAAQAEAAVLVDVPEEILEKHRAFLKRRRKRIVLLVIGSGLLAAACVVAGILVYQVSSGGESASPETQPTPSSPPPPLPAAVPEPPAAPPPPPSPIPPSKVYSVESNPHYHRGDCSVYLGGTGQRYEGTLDQAVAAGFRTPCPLCKPLETTPIAPPVSPQPFPASPPPDNDLSVVYVTPTGDLYHAFGCQALRGPSNPVATADAISRGYKPCPQCIRPAP
ncbi:MAG TPA: hypothetical protein PKL84_12485, partial [Candidatus Hydrogenedentes bacterium]|nr:hypothetical protein [Candidatus Hydrogenedentota bacterium]